MSFRVCWEGGGLWPHHPALLFVGGTSMSLPRLASPSRPTTASRLDLSAFNIDALVRSTHVATSSFADLVIEARVVSRLKNKHAPVADAVVVTQEIPPAHLRIRNNFLLAVRVGTAGDVVKYVYNPLVAGLDRPNPVRGAAFRCSYSPLSKLNLLMCRAGTAPFTSRQSGAQDLFSASCSRTQPS